MVEAATPKIYFDSNVLITAFEGAPEESEPLKELFACFKSTPLAAITSELTLAEVLGREASTGWLWQKRFYLGLLVWSHFVDLRPVTRSILEDTGSFRRHARANGRKHKLPDAIHLVSAVSCRCSLFLTFDKHLGGSVPAPLRHVVPDRAGVAAVKGFLRV